MVFINEYEQIKLNGKIGFSDIYKLLNNKNNKFYALKFVSNREINKFQKEHEMQIEINKNIKNKYIIELKDNYDEINKGYFIIVELCNENLKKILYKYKLNGIPLNIINKIFRQLNDAKNIMKVKNYIHTNLKPENIFIKYNDKNKITFENKLFNFLLSTKYINSSIHYFSKIGTLNYIISEIENNNYNNCDLWSLGLILYELYTNKYIFDSNNLKKSVINSYEGKLIKEKNNEMINNLIKKLIQIYNNKKIKWEKFFINKLFKNNINKKDTINHIKIINLKSPLLKIIFSFLNENKILNVIIYNRRIQKKLEVDIEIYKKISKSY